MVPSSKTSRAQPWREGWQPAAAGNKLRMQRQQVQLAGERCREPRQRLGTTPAQRDPGGAAQPGLGSPLQWLSPVLTEFVHGGFRPGQSGVTKEHLEVSTAIKQRHLQDGHSKGVMGSKKNKPWRSALLPSELWQLPAGQQPAEPLPCPAPNSHCARTSSTRLLLPVRDHRLPVGLIHLGRAGLHRSNEGCVLERGGDVAASAGGGNPFLGLWINV